MKGIKVQVHGECFVCESPFAATCDLAFVGGDEESVYTAQIETPSGWQAKEKGFMCLRCSQIAQGIQPIRLGDPCALTRREIEVLALLAQGLSYNRIGESLCIAHSTVAWHVSNIMSKMHVSSRWDASVKYQKGEFITR